MYGVIGGSKAALESLMRHFALELGDKGINFNIVKAGLVETDSTRRMPFLDEMVEATKKYRNMTGERTLTAEDVATRCLFLASPLADMVQGETLTVDCGAGVRASSLPADAVRDVSENRSAEHSRGRPLSAAGHGL